MSDKHLHIVSFDIPYPPTYGGAIDVYYRLRSLHAAGVKVILHCYYKPGEWAQYEALESECEKVYYYERRCGFVQNLYWRPYEAASRPSTALLKDLLEDDYPILFEGLMCCELIDHPGLRNRIRGFREGNVEHDYYWQLGRASSVWWKKAFYAIEACKLYFFERKVRQAQAVFAISHGDEQHFLQRYPKVKTIYLPGAHPFRKVESLTGKGEYLLYHGNLSVAENEKAALYIVRELAPQLPQRIVIAGMRPSERLISACQACENVRLIASPGMEEMTRLIQDAQLHLLVTFQPTGLKLKLLNVLYQGRHVVVNPAMVEGTELKELCHVGHSREELLELCQHYCAEPFSDESIRQREQLLGMHFSNEQNAQTVCAHFFPKTG